jgi:hypothetical protein
MKRTMNPMFYEMYDHMLTLSFKLINFYGQHYILTRYRTLNEEPGVLELGVFEYDKLLERYGIWQ